MRWLSIVVLIELSVAPIGEAVPSKPGNFIARQTTLKGNSALLGWDKLDPDKVKQIKEYRLTYYPSQSPDSAKHQTLNGTTEGLLVHNLQFLTNYIFQLIAIDLQNDASFTASSNFTTGEGTPSRPPQNVRVERVTSKEFKISWTPPPSDSLHGTLKSYRIKLHDVDTNVNTLYPVQRSQLFGFIEVENVTTSHRYTLSVCAVTIADGVYSEPIPIQIDESSDDNSSLVIIMCCAIIIPLVLIGLFVAFYILVLRPAFIAGKESIDGEVPDMDKSDVKLTDLSAIKSTNGDSGIVSDEKTQKLPV